MLNSFNIYLCVVISTYTCRSTHSHVNKTTDMDTYFDHFEFNDVSVVFLSTSTTASIELSIFF